MRDGHGGCDPTTHPELASYRDRARLDRGYEVVANLVRYRFVERALIAVAPQVELQALELDAQGVRNVIDRDRCEVGLSGHRAQAGELGTFKRDVIVATRLRVCERLQLLA